MEKWSHGSDPHSCPPDTYSYCLERLSALVEGGVEILASNQVIGEAFIVVQHHYGVSAEDAKTELRNVLRSGLVDTLNGSAVLEMLATRGGAGLFDRLLPTITRAQDWRR